jgi:tripartite-type tricarboxylate transporter receptor subunit TctC
MFPIRRRLHLALLAAAILGPFSAAAQEQWPQRPVRIVVPYSLGVSTDNVSRRIAQELSARLGQAVLVENKTGAMGTIGVAEVARARPDGHTLLGIDTGYVMLPHLVRSLPYDAARDLVPIAAYVFSPLGVVVNASSPYRTLRDLIERARSEPGRITFGSGGVGTFPQLATEDLASRTGVALLHVPFRGAAEAVQALLAGTIEMQIASPATVMGNLGAGRLRMLAIGGDRRLALLPDVPTFAEAGVDGFDLRNWIGLWAPRGTPPEVVERLRSEILAAMQTPGMRAYAEGIAAEPRVVVGDEFVRLLHDESARWKAVIDRIGLVPQ